MDQNVSFITKKWFDLVQYRSYLIYDDGLKMGVLCWLRPGKTNWRGRLSTVDLLIKVARFETKQNKIFNLRSTLS